MVYYFKNPAYMEKFEVLAILNEIIIFIFWNEP